jgi:hypothetical protein
MTKRKRGKSISPRQHQEMAQGLGPDPFTQKRARSHRCAFRPDCQRHARDSANVGDVPMHMTGHQQDATTRPSSRAVSSTNR